MALASPLLTSRSDVRQTETAPVTLELLTCWKFLPQPIPSHCWLHSWSPQETAAPPKTVVSAHLKFFLITTNTVPHWKHALRSQLAPLAAAASPHVTERDWNVTAGIEPLCTNWCCCSRSSPPESIQITSSSWKKQPEVDSPGELSHTTWRSPARLLNDSTTPAGCGASTRTALWVLGMPGCLSLLSVKLGWTPVCWRQWQGGYSHRKWDSHPSQLTHRYLLHKLPIGQGSSVSTKTRFSILASTYRHSEWQKQLTETCFEALMLLPEYKSAYSSHPSFYKSLTDRHRDAGLNPNTLSPGTYRTYNIQKEMVSHIFKELTETLKYIAS